MSKAQKNAPTASEELRSIIERYERLEEEKKGIAADQKDVLSEAKSRGYDPKTIREIIKLRKLTPEERREREGLLDTYKAALGMLDGTPLGQWAIERLEKKDEPASAGEGEAAVEPAYEDAVKSVIVNQNASVSWLQRSMRIGYNAAAALIERMQAEGIVSTPDAVGKRHVLRNPDGTVAEAPPPPAPEPTIDDARQLGTTAAQAGEPVTSNPFPARDPRRAAWDEAWCQALGTDGMDIPDALKPTPKPKKGGEGGEQ